MGKHLMRSGNAGFDALLVTVVTIILIATQALASLGQRFTPLEAVLNGVSGPILRTIARHALPMDVWLGFANREQLMLLESLVFALLCGVTAGTYLMYRGFRSRDKQPPRPRRKKKP